MPVFAIVAKDSARMAPAVAQVYPHDHFALWEGVWFVADEATTQEVAAKLGVPDGGRGSAVVTAVSNYWGYANKDLWEWFAVKGMVRREPTTR